MSAAFIVVVYYCYCSNENLKIVMFIHPERIELIQFYVPAGMWLMPFSCCRFGWTVPTQPVAITPSMTVRLFKRIISTPASASGMPLRRSGLGQDTLVLSAGRSSQRPLEVVSSPALPFCLLLSFSQMLWLTFLSLPLRCPVCVYLITPFCGSWTHAWICIHLK